MPSPVELTTEQLFAKIGELQMECLVRSRREDELLAQIAQLQTKGEPKGK